MSGPANELYYLVGLPRGDRKVLLSWRLLRGDPPNTPFHIMRRREAGDNWIRVTSTPVVDSTTFIDQTPEPRTYEYCVTRGEKLSEIITVDASAHPDLVALSISLDSDLTVGGIAIGDLTTGGRMGYVVRAVRGGTVWILAYAHDGKAMWEMDTRLPGHGGWDGSTLHVPFLCWDLNGDGRVEVAFPTTATSSRQSGIGEYLIAVDGQSGSIVWQTPWPATQERVMMTAGHLRGLDKPASVVVLDGTYGDVALTAIDGQSAKVLWRVKQARPAGHNLDIADLDGDGVQKVICGGVCYHGDGTVRWEAEPFGHTNISKPALIDPSRSGLQIWYAVERHNPGVYFVDKDGNTIFKEPFRHGHYGWVARHTARVPGLQPHTAEDARHDHGTREEGHFPIFLPDGTHWLNLTDWQRKNFVPLHWDEGPEVVFAIRKENKRVVRLRESGQIEDLPESKLPEGGQYGRNLICADIIGDFREEIVAFDSEDHRLVVLSNPTLAQGRGHSPYEDFGYRHDRSQHGSGYYIYLSPPDMRRYRFAGG